MKVQEKLDLELKTSVERFNKVQEHYDNLINTINEIIDNSDNIKVLFKKDIDDQSKFTFLNNIPIIINLINKIDIGVITIKFYNNDSKQYRILDKIITYDYLGNIKDYKNIDTINDDNVVIKIIETLIKNKDAICENAFPSNKDSTTLV